MADKWAANSNKALSLQLVRPKDSSSASETSSFHPEFTYAIFGEAETIYGYSGLNVQLHFASGSLAPLLDVQWKAKNESTTAKLDDVEETLKEFLPAEYNTSASEFSTRVEQDARDFQPLGEKIASYTRRKAGEKGKGKAKSAGSGSGAQLSEEDPEARVFEMYKASWATPGFREFHRRMQIFVLLYIEGASYIVEEEENWEFIVLYERERLPKTKSDDPDSSEFRWHFVGYTSLYRFWCWPDSQRVRLSQFVILPPWQNQGHGTALYTQVLDEMLKRPAVTELTVEDPSEAFDRLRDSSDLRRLMRPGGFVEQARKEGRLVPPVNSEWAERARREVKIAGRQFSRLLEMFILLNLDPSDLRAVRAYRLQVKSRLYRFNKDVLTQLPREERVAKLQETFASVIDEYGELIGVDVESILDAPLGAGANGSGSGRGIEDAEGPPRKMARFG